MEKNPFYLDRVAQELALNPGLSAQSIIERVAATPDNLFSFTTDRLKQDARLWREVLKPILGLLLAARRSLSRHAIRALLDLTAEDMLLGLKRLGGLVEGEGLDHYTVCHHHVRDYLRERSEQPEKYYIFALDEEQQYHQRLLSWCEGGKGGIDTIWADALHDPLELERRDYARNYYVAHLVATGLSDRLWRVLDLGAYGEAKLRHDPTTRSLHWDLNLICQALEAEGNGNEAQRLEMLPTLWRCVLLRGSLSSQADSLPASLFAILAALGRVQEALRLAEVLSKPEQQARALAHIAAQLLEKQTIDADGTFVLDRALRISHSLAHQPERRCATLLAIAEPLVLAEPSVTHGLQILSDAALVAAELRPPPRAQICALLARQFARAGRIDSARACLSNVQTVISNIPEPFERVVALEVIAMALMDIDARDLAQLITDEMLAVVWTINPWRLRESALHIGARCLERVGRAGEAETISGHLSSQQLVVQTLADRAGACAAIGDLVAASALLRRAVEAIRTLTGPRPTDVLKAVISAAIAMGQLDEAQSLLSALPLSEREQIQYHIATVLCEANRLDEAQALMGKLRSQFYVGAAQSALVDAQLRLGNPLGALNEARAIKQREKRAHALQRVAAYWTEAGTIEQANYIVDEALGAVRVQEDSPARDLVLRTLSAALAQFGKHSYADELVRLIRDVHQRDQALYQAISTAAQAGEADITSVVDEGIAGIVHRREALRTFIFVLANKGCIGEALAHIEMSAGTERVALFQAAAEGLAANGQIEAACVVACTIEATSERDSILHAVALALAQTHRGTAALELIHRYISVSHQEQSISAVAKTLAKARAHDAALAALNHIGEPYLRAVTLTLIATAPTVEILRSSQLLEEAQLQVENIEDPARRNDACHILATAWAGGNNYLPAKRVAMSITDPYTQLFTLQSLATHALQAGRTARAKELTEAIWRQIDTLENVAQRNMILQDLTAAMAETHGRAAAELVLCAISDPDVRQMALAGLAGTLVRLHDTRGALVLIAELQADSPPGQPWGTIIVTEQMKMLDTEALGLAWEALLQAPTANAAWHTLPFITPLLRRVPSLAQRISEDAAWVQQFLLGAGKR